MTSISDIDEDVINRNLQTRYSENHIYVSFCIINNKILIYYESNENIVENSIY